MFRTIILIGLLTLPVMAEEETYDYIRPVIGDNVVRRHQENLKTIDLNIRSIQDSMKNAEKNIKTLEEEITRLDQIFDEHVELKKRYQNYLTSAEAEIKKFEETHPKRETASKEGETDDAAAWREDAKTKTDAVKQYLVKADANLAQAKSDRDKNATTLEQTRDKKTRLGRDLEVAMQKKNQLMRDVRESMTKRVTTSVRLPQGN